MFKTVLALTLLFMKSLTVFNLQPVVSMQYKWTFFYKQIYQIILKQFSYYDQYYIRGNNLRHGIDVVNTSYDSIFDLQGKFFPS